MREDTSAVPALPPTVHGLDCPKATGLPVANARTVDAYARPHGCAGGTWAQVTVAVEAAVHDPHPWQTSMIWPAGEPAVRCRACRGRKDHPIHDQGAVAAEPGLS